MQRARRGVVIVGPVGARGGIASVVRNVLETGTVQGEFDVRLVNTSVYKDGGVRDELRVLSRGLGEFLVMMAEPRFTVIHIHVSYGVSFYRKLIFLAIAHVLRRRVILHFHSGRLNEFYLTGIPRLRRRLIAAALRWSEVAVVLGSNLRSALTREYGNVRVAIVPNPLPGRLPLASIERSVDPRPRPTRFLFVGFLIEDKGVFDLIEATARVRGSGAEMVVSMCGLGEAEQRLRERIVALGLESSVTIRGWVDGDSLFMEFERADVLVLPSYYEGLPNAVLEAMAAGLPVVCSPVGAIPDVLDQPAGALFVEPGDIEGLSNALGRLCADPNLRMSMGSHNRMAAAHLTPQSVARQWADLYSELSSSPGHEPKPVVNGELPMSRRA